MQASENQAGLLTAKAVAVAVRTIDEYGAVRGDGEKAQAFVRALAAHIAALTAENERLRQERADALSVTTREGLLASEWVLRTGTAERERDALKADVEQLRADNAAIVEACSAYFEFHGAQHEEDDCPEDDTCKCPYVVAVNDALSRSHPGAALLEQHRKAVEGKGESIKILGHHLATVVRKLRAKDLGPEYATITIRHDRTDLALFENALKAAGVTP